MVQSCGRSSNSISPLFTHVYKYTVSIVLAQGRGCSRWAAERDWAAQQLCALRGHGQHSRHPLPGWRWAGQHSNCEHDSCAYMYMYVVTGVKWRLLLLMHINLVVKAMLWSLCQVTNVLQTITRSCASSHSHCIEHVHVSSIWRVWQVLNP